MGDSTHTLTLQATQATTGQITVPASVQREEGICIDDTVEVTIHLESGLFDSLSFQNPQTAGDRITVPAHVVRRADLEAGTEYEVEFDAVEPDESESEEAEPDAIDDEIEEEAEEIIESIEEDYTSVPGDDEEEEEEESEGLGQLFG